VAVVGEIFSEVYTIVHTSHAHTHTLTHAASRTLPSGKAPFVALLGVYGRGVSHGGGDEGGADCCYALHADGSLTIWLRTPGGCCYINIYIFSPYNCKFRMSCRPL